MNKLLTTITLFCFSVAANAQVNDFSLVKHFRCGFDEHYVVYVKEEKFEKYDKGMTLLEIQDGIQTSATSSLDGSERASNSTKWQLLQESDFQTTYSGDFGDVLVIFFSPSNPDGIHRATLQWGALNYAYTDKGMCMRVLD